MQAMKKGLQVISEVEALIINKSSTKIRFGDKMANNGGKVFQETTHFYKSPNYATVLVPEKCKSEWKADINPEGTAVNKQ